MQFSDTKTERGGHRAVKEQGFLCNPHGNYKENIYRIYIQKETRTFHLKKNQQNTKDRNTKNKEQNALEHTENNTVTEALCVSVITKCKWIKLFNQDWQNR